MKKAIFPGSFDPLHEGHLNIIEKSLKLFDHIVLIVSVNKEKSNSNNIVKRFNDVKKKLINNKNISVIINENNMISNIAKELKINYIIRSARNNKDFQYELELAAANKNINSELETILIIPDYKNIKFESRLEKQKI